MKNKLLLLLLLFAYFPLSAQLQFFSPEAMNGYTLFIGDRLYLVNNCGEQVHSWGLLAPQYHVKLLPNGNIVFIDWIGNSVIEKDWNDNLVKEITPQADDIELDYEVIVLENGNYLCVGRKAFSLEEFEEIGYNLDDLGFPIHTDVVVELDSETGEIVWLWNIADHVIQERSDTIANYGVVAEHPELLNIDAISTFDWTSTESWMINGMDYHPGLDQIVLSVRKMGEIIIIDHSTTTEEAAGHTGGSAGKGGDILYRWGNPQNYHRGTADDQHLFFQHNPNWIQYGEHIGKIAIYDNGLNRPNVSFEDRYSTAPIIETPLQTDGTYALEENLAYEPSTPNVIYGLPDGENHFYSDFTSATKVLSNGNILITIGDENQVLELKPDGTKVWEYDLATAGFTFRAEKYSSDYPAFEGRDLTPMETIEMPPSNVACDLEPNSNEEISTDDFLKAWLNPHSRELFVQATIGKDYEMAIYDVLGKKLQSFKLASQVNVAYQFSIAAHINGVFILNVVDTATGQQKSTKLFLP